MNPLFIRTRVTEELELLGSDFAQLRYEQNVPIANVPAELVCGWFDDLYHPQAVEFQRAFSSAELTALADFSTFFEARIANLPRTAAELVLQPRWKEIMRRARYTLSLIQSRKPGASVPLTPWTDAVTASVFCPNWRNEQSRSSTRGK
jgi:hypothetical protein